jgi:hypothetical protein
MKRTQMWRCFNCGAELGLYAAEHDTRDTCGSIECRRALQEAELQERSDAHEQLDRERGWDQYR